MSKQTPEQFPPKLYLKRTNIAAAGIVPAFLCKAQETPKAGYEPYIHDSLLSAAVKEAAEKARREIEELKKQNRILAINGNNDEARCVEVGMLQEELSAAQAEVERLREQVELSAKCLEINAQEIRAAVREIDDDVFENWDEGSESLRAVSERMKIASTNCRAALAPQEQGKKESGDD